jgi:hypothetical protein
VSFHQDGSVITYAMYSELRRQERREEILDYLGSMYSIDRRYSFEQYEEEHKFLEGTGSMVLDRANKIVYACLSPRTDIRLLDKFCVLKGYRKICFTAVSKDAEIYHTNVMMSLGGGFAVVCLTCIPEPGEQKALVDSLEASGKEIVEINEAQMHAYAGNMLQLSSLDGNNYIIMSTQAYQSLSKHQIERLSIYGELLHCPIPIIEKYGGGSARCMIAEIFNPKLPV